MIERLLGERRVLPGSRLPVVERPGREQDVVQLDLEADALGVGQRARPAAGPCARATARRRSRRSAGTSRPADTIARAASPGSPLCVAWWARSAARARSRRRVLLEQLGDAAVHDLAAQRRDVVVDAAGDQFVREAQALLGRPAASRGARHPRAPRRPRRVEPGQLHERGRSRCGAQHGGPAQHLGRRRHRSARASRGPGRPGCRCRSPAPRHGPARSRAAGCRPIRGQGVRRRPPAPGLRSALRCRRRTAARAPPRSACRRDAGRATRAACGALSRSSPSPGRHDARAPAGRGSCAARSAAPRRSTRRTSARRRRPARRDARADSLATSSLRPANRRSRLAVVRATEDRLGMARRRSPRSASIHSANGRMASDSNAVACSTKASRIAARSSRR